MTVLVSQPGCEAVPSHPATSKHNEVETSHVESEEKDENDAGENNELEEKEGEKDDDNGDDEMQSTEEV